MPTCIQQDVNGNLQVVNPQPADLTTCKFVILTPSEVPGVTQGMDAAQAAGFFVFGFSIVLGTYLVAYQVGAILKVLRTARN